MFNSVKKNSAMSVYYNVKNKKYWTDETGDQCNPLLSQAMTQC